MSQSPFSGRSDSDKGAAAQDAAARRHKALLAGGLIQTCRRGACLAQGAQGHKALLAGGLIQTIWMIVEGALVLRHKALLAGGLIQTLAEIVVWAGALGHKALLAGGLIQTEDQRPSQRRPHQVTKPF